MAIKFSQFNERTDHTSGMYLVGYDGNQNIHITVDNLFNDFINGTANKLAMFGSGGDTVVDSIVTQNVGNTGVEIDGSLIVENNVTLNDNLTVDGGSATFNGDVNLGSSTGHLITQTGTLYLNGPVKDSTDTLGTANQLLQSNANGELVFINTSSLNIGSAENTKIEVTNKQGSALTKGDPVFISGSTAGQGLEVKLADASNAAKMPAVGILETDLNNNATGHALIVGKLSSINTSTIDGTAPTPGQPIYVKPSGSTGAAITTTKPVQGNFIQNLGEVGTVAAAGTLVFTVKAETNDVPNVTPGRLLIGSAGNTIESQTLFVNEAFNTVGINTTSPAYTLTVDGDIGISNYIQHNGDADTKFGFEANDVFIINTSGSERFKVSSGGNIGINTSTPQRTLDVNGVILSSNRTGQAFRAESTGNGFAVMEFENNNPLYRLRSNANQESVKIKSVGDSYFTGGKVGVGNASPGSQLDVSTSSSFPAATISNTNTTGVGLVVSKNSSNTGDIQRWQYTNNTVKAVVDSDGKFGIGLTNPLFAVDVYNDKGLRARKTSSADGFAIVALNSLSSPTSACGIYYTNNVGSLILNDTTQNQNVKIQASGDSYIKGGKFFIGGDPATTTTDTVFFVQDGDVEIKRPASGTSGGGIILQTPDKTKQYKVTIDNSGNLVTTLV